MNHICLPLTSCERRRKKRSDITSQHGKSVSFPLDQVFGTVKVTGRSCQSRKNFLHESLKDCMTANRSIFPSPSLMIASLGGNAGEAASRVDHPKRHPKRVKPTTHDRPAQNMLIWGRGPNDDAWVVRRVVPRTPTWKHLLGPWLAERQPTTFAT